jgi:N-acetylglucosamine malate deacetylase 1
MKKIWLLLFLFCTSFAWSQEVKHDTLRNIVIITAHPDDWEMAMGGTAYLLKDKYHIHVVLVSKGERGLSAEPSETTANLRVSQSVEGCKRINGQLHFLGKMDGEIYADKPGVDSLVSLLKKLNPVMIFTHWPLDKPDHSAVAEMVIKALYNTSLVYDHEVYFFGVQQPSLQHFDPEIYVNITSVVETKKELIRLHSLHPDDEDRLVNATIDLDRWYGLAARCDYAEAFRTFYPPISNRWDKKVRFTLLDL